MGTKRTRWIALAGVIAISATLVGPTAYEGLWGAERELPEDCRAIVTEFVDGLQVYIDETGDLDADALAEARTVSDVFAAAVPSYQQRLDTADCGDLDVQPALVNALDELRWYGAVASVVGPVVKAAALGEEAPDLPTLTVAPSDDLAAVVVITPVGTVLELEAGEHRLEESLVLERPFTLVGEGAESTTVVSSAPGFAILGGGAGPLRLEGLTVARRTDEPGSVVVVQSGSYRLTDLVVEGGVPDAEGDGGAGLALGTSDTSAASVTPGLRLVERSVIRNNGGAGIVLADGHEPDIVDTTVTGSALCGVCYLDGSGGTLRDSVVTANETGIAVAGSAAPRVVRTTVEDNAGTGLVFEEEGAGAVRDSVVRANGTIGVLLADYATPRISQNTISEHAEAGVAYRDDAAGRLDGNVLEGQPVAVWLEGSASPDIEGNDLAEAEAGIVFNDDASGRAVRNVCAEGVLLALLDSADPVLDGNDCEVADER